ncbi:MAG: hypothetical protein ICV85_12340 [Tolypothrix sp. T3-bin4]|nr:hypothetical protein [Tolypothrix sp. Co-bin9]MBD0302924.1 hypothetical protein [Tolypothrix sp. T3-bin4]
MHIWDAPSASECFITRYDRVRYRVLSYGGGRQINVYGKSGKTRRVHIPQELWLSRFGISG